MGIQRVLCFNQPHDDQDRAQGVGRFVQRGLPQVFLHVARLTRHYVAHTSGNNLGREAAAVVCLRRVCSVLCKVYQGASGLRCASGQAFGAVLVNEESFR